MVQLRAVLPFGIVIGSKNAPRILSMSMTSQVQNFDETNLSLGRTIVTTDKGYQFHLYTQEHDLLVVRVPPEDLSLEALNLVFLAVGVNRQIWEYFTGLKLCGSIKEQVVMVSESSNAGFADKKAIKPFNFHVGTLDEISKQVFLQKGIQMVLPIISPHRIHGIKITPSLKSVASCVWKLNDKNIAIPYLKKFGIPVPETYPVNDPTEIASMISKLNPEKKYVFKLAGSIAGFGMFTNHDQGCTPQEIGQYLENLQKAGKPSLHFQIQEFIKGTSYGGIVMIDMNRNIQLLSVHRQIIREGNFLGLLWEPQIEAEHGKFVINCVKKLLVQKETKLLGPYNLDFMVQEDGAKYVTEINPRYSAGVVFHFVRKVASNIQKRHSDFTVKKIFLDTTIRFSKKIIESGKLPETVQKIYRGFKTVILPQGINPFGNSSVLFVNDLDGKARAEFIRQVMD
jgi:hypothetical protein